MKTSKKKHTKNSARTSKKNAKTTKKKNKKWKQPKKKQTRSENKQKKTKWKQPKKKNKPIESDDNCGGVVHCAQFDGSLDKFPWSFFNSFTFLDNINCPLICQNIPQPIRCQYHEFICKNVLYSNFVFLDPRSGFRFYFFQFRFGFRFCFFGLDFVFLDPVLHFVFSV